MHAPKKPLVEDCFVLNADELRRVLERSSLSAPATLTVTHPREAGLVTLWRPVRMGEPAVFNVTYGCRGARMSYNVELGWLPQRLGARLIFFCPVRGCKRQARKLYMPLSEVFKWFVCHRHVDYLSHRRPWLGPIRGLIEILAAAQDLQEAKGKMRDLLKSASWGNESI